MFTDTSVSPLQFSPHRQIIDAHNFFSTKDSVCSSMKVCLRSRDIYQVLGNEVFNSSTYRGYTGSWAPREKPRRSLLTTNCSSYPNVLEWLDFTPGHYIYAVNVWIFTFWIWKPTGGVGKHTIEWQMLQICTYSRDFVMRQVWTYRGERSAKQDQLPWAPWFKCPLRQVETSPTDWRRISFSPEWRENWSYSQSVQT